MLICIRASSACPQTKNTGQLSVVTFIANVLGCIARIFTSYQEGGGIVMIRGFVLGEQLPRMSSCIAACIT